MKTFTKQPTEVEDYDIEFGRWFDARGGDTISSVVVSFTGPDATLELGPGALPESVLVPDKTTGALNQTVKVWVGAGTDGKTYKVTVLVTSSGGRVKDRDFQVRVRAK